MKRRTIGENPLDALVPLTETKRKPPASPPVAPRAARERLTVHLPSEAIDRARDAVFWSPGLTLAGLVETGLALAVEKLEKKNGKPFAARTGALRMGRPVR